MIGKLRLIRDALVIICSEALVRKTPWPRVSNAVMTMMSAAFMPTGVEETVQVIAGAGIAAHLKTAWRRIMTTNFIKLKEVSIFQPH